MPGTLITGGTGSFGQACVKTLLETTNIERIAVYSRDEYKHAQMDASLASHPDRYRDPLSREGTSMPDRLRFFVGDTRDQQRLTLAMRGIDTVIHAAALKRVDLLEYNPSEAVETNVVGSMNVIWAAIANDVNQVMALSTDKACSPVNLYGATKLCMEKLMVAANAYQGPKFSCVRYGNVAGSRGSVIPLYLDKRAKDEPLPITDINMTRYWMTLPQAVDFVLSSMDMMEGGEVFIPHLPSVKVTTIAEAVGGQREVVGIRPGEKIHETMVSTEEKGRCRELVDRYVLTDGDLGKPLSETFPSWSYCSNANGEWLNADDVRFFLDTHDA